MKEAYFPSFGGITRQEGGYSPKKISSKSNKPGKSTKGAMTIIVPHLDSLKIP